jgi:hypothetical protein
LKKYPFIAAAAAILLVIAIGFIFSGRSITVSAVPFGLPAGAKIPLGKKAKFPSMPTSTETDLRRAKDLQIAGAVQAAQNNYEAILLKYPDLPAALFGAAYSIAIGDSISEEKNDKAKRFTESLAHKMPGSIWVKLLLTFFEEYNGSINNALNIAAELTEESPAFAEARLRYSDLLLKTEQPAKAADEAKAAISITAGLDARAYVNLAFALHKMGNIDECSDLINYALPRFPSQTELLLLYGYLSEYSRDFDNAQNAYKRILALKPGEVNAHNAIATLGEKTPPVAGAAANSSGGGISLKEQAKETAKIILPLIGEYPENLPLREALGKIYLKARMLKEARAQFSEIYEQDFEYPNIRKLLNESSEEIQPKPITPHYQQNSKNLADSLAKTFAALRKNEKSDYDDLGRYLAHYGATLKEFFSKYSITRFKKDSDGKTFYERYIIDSFIYENTVFFDIKQKFYAVRSIITNSTNSKDFDYIADTFGHFLKKETGALGEGSAMETTDCYGEKWSGIVWVSSDNFEILMQGSRNLNKVFIIRLHAKRFPDTGNLCS